jgi:hypothetical protein
VAAAAEARAQQQQQQHAAPCTPAQEEEARKQREYAAEVAATYLAQRYTTPGWAAAAAAAAATATTGVNVSTTTGTVPPLAAPSLLMAHPASTSRALPPPYSPLPSPSLAAAGSTALAAAVHVVHTTGGLQSAALQATEAQCGQMLPDGAMQAGLAATAVGRAQEVDGRGDGGNSWQEGGQPLPSRQPHNTVVMTRWVHLVD